MNSPILRNLFSLCCCLIALSIAPALRAAVPTLTRPALSQKGANQVTLTLESSEDGRGYFTLLPGLDAVPGSGEQVAAGKDSTDAAALRMGSLPLQAGVRGTYTISNLTANTNYTVCFTADDGASLQSVPETVSFTTSVATDLTGKEWEAVGGAGFSEEDSINASLAIGPDGTPYVTFLQSNTDGKAAAMRFNGLGWEIVGGGGLSAGQVRSPSPVFAPDGSFYVSYEDRANDDKATVMRLEGTEWTAVGSAGVSAGRGGQPSLAFAPDSPRQKLGVCRWRSLRRALCTSRTAPLTK